MRIGGGVVVAVLAARTAVAQAPSTAQRDYKNPTTAALWSVPIPGAGLMYAGQTLGGFMMMGTTMAAFGAMMQPRDTISMSGPECLSREPSCRVELTSWSKQRIAGYVGAGLWTLSIVVAPIAARAHNESYRLHATVTPGVSRSTNIGLSLRF